LTIFVESNIIISTFTRFYLFPRKDDGKEWFTERFRAVAKSIRKNRSIWIAVCSLAVALIALLLSVNPKIIPWNRNHIGRANVGDVYSQMFLAEHYFEIGDYSEAIYWYKIASIEPSEYQVYACNNLGFYMLRDLVYRIMKTMDTEDFK